MPYKFYKTSNLNTTGSIPQNFAYVKTNVENATDGGILLKAMSGEYGAVRNIIYFSGSISSPGSAGVQIAQFVNSLTSPNNPFEEISEGDFNTYLTETESFINSLS